MITDWAAFNLSSNENSEWKSPINKSLAFSNTLPLQPYLPWAWACADLLTPLKKGQTNHQFVFLSEFWTKGPCHLLYCDINSFFYQVYRKYRKYMVELVSSHYHRLGWKDEGRHTDKLNRYNILNLACDHGYKPCNERAEQIFNQWIKDPDFYIKPNIRHYNRHNS